MEPKFGEIGIRINNKLHIYKTRCVGNKSYRYGLELRLKEGNNDKKTMFILKNPSEADNLKKDNTIGRLAGWAYNNDIHNFTVCNLFGRRDKDPNVLKGLSQSERIGERNDDKIKECLKEHEEIILGWGTPKPLPEKDYDSRIKEVLDFEAIRINKYLFKVGNCLEEKYPKHPRLWSYKTDKLPFDIQKALESL